MSLIRFFFSKKFYKHIIIAIVLTVVFVFIILKLLDFYTNHGESITVPDFTGLSVDELDEYSMNRNFRFEIIDSIHHPTKEKGSVIAQDPLPNSKVKQNRKIYITVVAKHPEQVSMPDLIDLTLRQARARLETYGLDIDSLEYIPDLARNAVIYQKFEGKNIENETMIEKGSKIVLVLGLGLSNERISVPLLYGKKQADAKRVLLDASLNIGIEIFEDGDDTAHARVYKQKPYYSRKTYLRLGETVDIWYRSDLKFDFKLKIAEYEQDTIIVTDTIEE